MEKGFEELKEEIRKELTEYIEQSGYKFNPDKKKVDLILTGLAKKKIKFGEKYCPCRIISGDKEENKKIICPCVFHKEEIKKDGICHCELFIGQKA